MRILIVGPSGVGKTTIARRIKDAQGLPLIELDDFFGGKRLPQEEADEIVRKVLDSNESWIIEGAYLFPELFEKATHIIIVEVPYWSALYRAWRRYFVRLWRRDFKYGNKSLFLTTKHITKMYFSTKPRKNYKSFRLRTAREWGNQYHEKIELGKKLL